jgi:hypothetical protein
MSPVDISCVVSCDPSKQKRIRAEEAGVDERWITMEGIQQHRLSFLQKHAESMMIAAAERK